jgi:hypothetical protein
MKITTTTWPALAEAVSPGCYRFFCKFLRYNQFDKTTVLEIDGDEFTLPDSQVRVGLSEGKLKCDIRERMAKTLGLI